MANPIAVPGTNVPSGAAVSPGGAQGLAGTPAWTTSTGGFTVPAIGSTVSVTVVDTSWMTVGEYVYVAGANGSGQAGALQITAIAGTTVTLLNPPAPGSGLGEAPTDGQMYGRKNATWSVVPPAGISTDALNIAKLGSDGLVYVRQGPNMLVTGASFTCPAYFATVAITIASTAWVTIGDKLFFAGIGKFLVTAVTSVTAITILNTGDPGNASSGTVASGTQAVLIPNTEEESILCRIRDHFVNANGPGYLNFAGNSGTGAAQYNSNNFGDAVHPGCAAVQSGTVASSCAYIESTQSLILGSGPISFRAVVQPAGTKPTSTAANLAVILCGLGFISGGPPTTVTPTDFVGFTFNPGSGMANAANNWGFLTRKAGVSTYTDTGFAFTTAAWADLSFYVDTNGAKFRAFPWNGTVQNASSLITTNLPATTVSLGLIYNIINGASGTTSYTEWIDLWEAYQRVGTVTCAFRGKNLIDAF